MPTHDSATWVNDTLDSLIAQTWPRIELIVVDDASSDSTVATVRGKLTAGFKHLWRIIELPENRGPSAARNIGVKAASGAWVQFLDSDDFMAPDKIALQMAYCRLAPADVVAVYSAWRRCHVEDGEVVPEGPLMQPAIAGRAAIALMVGHDRPCNWAGLMRRSALDRVGGFNESLRVWEHEELMLRLAQAGRLEVVPSEKPLYLWRRHLNRDPPSGRSAREESRATALAWIEQLVGAADHRTFDEMNLSEADRADILNFTTEMARGLYGDNRHAFRQFLGQARELDSRIGPAYPHHASMLSRSVGYEAAEAVARLVRVPAAVALAFGAFWDQIPF